MLSVALLIKSFDLTVLILMPYSALSRGLAPAERSVGSNALGKLSLVALFLSMKNGILVQPYQHGGIASQLPDYRHVRTLHCGPSDSENSSVQFFVG